MMMLTVLFASKGFCLKTTGNYGTLTPTVVDACATSPAPTAEMNHDSPTVDATATSPDPTAEMNHDHDSLTVESPPRPVVDQESISQWLQSSSSSEQSETASQEYYVDVSSPQLILAIASEEQLMNVTEHVGEEVNTGLTVEVIDENLRRRTYENSNDETEPCVICQQKLKNGEEAAKLDCEHDFHFECIKSWLMVKNKCPLCNQKVV
ncbi:PREDICTED: E3 ubiquitin ligase BIG BROTHER-like [Camelina sativa]|uniref:RING-type E3 ubiquitin transferase n=1 Tax=Camelina sativa TaxID=90675 RepID=A0ABM0XFN9_CAMSA|nr:PREDICTED: E3 ubiquitin ligase BIG BROTHER-like [Camelina sativa]